jgi:hypothetical protein
VKSVLFVLSVLFAVPACCGWALLLYVCGLSGVLFIPRRSRASAPVPRAYAWKEKEFAGGSH